MSDYFAADMAEQNALNKRRNKKKLNELLDKYGESKEAINQHSDLKDSMEYIFSQGDELIDEVLEERRQKRAQSSFPQTPYPSAVRNNPEYVAQNNLSETEEENRCKNNNVNGEQPKNYQSSSDKYFDDKHWKLLGYLESGNRYGKILNGQKGAWGMYQMRTNALKDTGYMNKDGNWSGRDGIKSEDDFYNHPEIQEKAIRELMDIFLYRLRNYTRYENTHISGKKENFDISIRGMLAASHRVGQEYVKKYLNLFEKGENGRYYFPYDKVSMKDREKYELVETRLRKFSN